MEGLFISGSSTGVGKTLVAKYLIELLVTSRMVSARKPIETDCKNLGGELLAKDALLLSTASNANEPIDTVCRYKFKGCVSGEMAAKHVKVSLSLDDLLQASMADNFVVIEGAGGLLSPMAIKVLNADLVRSLKIPLVLVIKDELGAVNQALLCISAAKEYELNVSMLVLSQIKPNFLDNANAITKYTKTPIVEFNLNSLSTFKQNVRKILASF